MKTRSTSYFLIHSLMAFILSTSVLLITPSVMASSAVQTLWNGIQLNANLVIRDGGKISDDVILITHGTLGHAGMETIQAFQTAFQDRGRNSLAITLSLGVNNRTGMYDCSTKQTHLHTDALDEIQVWINWLKTKGVKKITLMGHSRGGNQTAWFASTVLDPIVDKVVLLAPMVWNKNAAMAGYKKQYGMALAEPLKRAQALVKQDKAGQFMEKTGLLYCPNATVTAATFLSYYQPNPKFDTPSLLTSIKRPVLVIAGDKDNVVKGLINAVRPLSNGKQISLKVIEGSNHFFLDFYAEDAADVIDEFLGS